MNLPHPRATRLQNFVWTLRNHGNEIEDLNVPVLLSHNIWLTEDALREEWAIQQNGTRKLPEEVAAAARPAITQEEVDE